MSALSPLPCWKPKGLPLPQSPVSPQTAPVGPDLAPLFWSVPRQGSGAPCSTHHSPPFRSGPILLLSGLIYPPWIHATRAEQTAPLPAGLSLKGSLLPGSHWSQASSRTPNGLLPQPYWLCTSRCGQDTRGKTSCNVQRGLSPQRVLPSALSKALMWDMPQTTLCCPVHLPISRST